jgi:hypothetical protein
VIQENTQNQGKHLFRHGTHNGIETILKWLEDQRCYNKNTKAENTKWWH